MNYGYIRVSSSDQKIDRQLIEIKKLNIPEKNIFIDHQSGKNFDRKNYQILRTKLQKDDVVYIKSIDRLGRNYEMIIDEWKYLTHVKKVIIIVLDMPLLNFDFNDKLVSAFVNDIVLQLLSFVAQRERENTKERQREGIAAAKLRGVVFGRPRLKISSDFEKLVKEYSKKEKTLKDVCSELQMSRSAFYRYSALLRKRYFKRKRLESNA